MLSIVFEMFVSKSGDPSDPEVGSITNYYVKGWKDLMPAILQGEVWLLLKDNKI